MPGQAYLKTVTSTGFPLDECNSLPPEVRSACNVDKFKANVIQFVKKL